MPRASTLPSATRELLDSWGRRGNRYLTDRECGTCKSLFRPKASHNKYCSRACMGIAQRLDIAAMRRSFEANLMPIPESGCWMWLGSTDDKGYGRYRTRVKTSLPKLTHRLSWVFNFGEIPDGMKVCHKCDVRCCVNPNHLFLGTQKDNLRDMVRKGRGRKPGPRVKRNDY